MSRKFYTSRNDLIQAEIIDPLEANDVIEDARESFDVDSISDEMIQLDGWAGYFVPDGVNVFEVAEKHAK